MQNMMDMVAKNPEMLKAAMSMMGENHPLSGMLKNKKPEEVAKYLGWASKGMKIFGKISPVLIFIKNYYKLIFGVLIAYIIFRYMS